MEPAWSLLTFDRCGPCGREPPAVATAIRIAKAISRWSVFTARLQIRVTNDTAVIYVVEAGDVANLSPGISF